MSHKITETMEVVRWGASGGCGNTLTVDGLEYIDEDRVYIRVNEHFEVRIVKTDEGIVVDIFAVKGNDAFSDALGSTYAFDAEATLDVED